MDRIYLDNNATTALAPEVLEVMQKALAMGPANPSSIHFFGRDARSKLIEAREKIADFLGVKPQDLVFTSGGTEAINFLIRGAVSSLQKGKILTSNIEHSSIETTLACLEKEGWGIERLPANLLGTVTVDQIKKAIDSQTRLIVLSAVNSETGVKAPIEEIAHLCEERLIPLIVDGVALLGKESISLPQGIWGMAFSSHKIHGPKGVGLAFVRPRLKISPLLTGGPQEFGKRAGTENLEGILGFSQAILLLKEGLSQTTLHMAALRNKFENALIAGCQAQVNGQGPRVSNTTNLAFPDIDGETLLIHLDMAGIAASHGSACSSGSLEPSRVLLNMGIPPHLAKSSIRFSLSRFSTAREIERAVQIITDLVARLRDL